MTCEAIPKELKTLERWVCWRWEHDGITWRKPPIDCHSGRSADVTRLQHHSTFEDAFAYYQNHSDVDGIGLVLARDGYCVVDLDDSRHPSSGDLEPRAAELIKKVGSYTEVSPSGRGVHVISRGFLPASRNSKNIELYDNKRYITVTGKRLDDKPKSIRSAQVEVLSIYHSLPGESQTVDDVVALLNTHPRALALWNGDVSAYKSHSEADLALCSYLAGFSNGHWSLIEQAFSKSRLYRDKWRRRTDYRQRTIRHAILSRRSFASNASVSSMNSEVSLPLDERAALVLSKYATEATGMPDWKVSWHIAKRLRSLTDCQPEHFQEPIRAFCEESGRHFDDIWYDFLDEWDKVLKPETEELLPCIVDKAMNEPYPNLVTSRGERYVHLASVAWHLSVFMARKPIQLPQEKLAQHLGVSAQTISNIIKLLKRDGLLEEVENECAGGYSYRDGIAKDYRFIGK